MQKKGPLQGEPLYVQCTKASHILTHPNLFPWDVPLKTRVSKVQGLLVWDCLARNFFSYARPTVLLFPNFCLWKNGPSRQSFI